MCEECVRNAARVEASVSVVVPGFEQMTIGHCNATEHGTDDAHETLIRSANEQVFQMRGPAPARFGRP